VTKPLIHSHFLNGLKDIIREHGQNPLDYAEKAGLPASIFAEKEFLLPYEKHTLIMELVSKHLNFPDMGLEIARRQTVSVFGPLFPMIANQSNIQEALELFSKHIQIRAQNIRLMLETTIDKASAAPRSDLDIINNSRTFEDHALGLAWQIIQLLHGGNCKLRAVYFKHPAPKDTSRYSRYFKCPVAFEHHCCELVIDPKILSEPICAKAKEIPQLLRQHLEYKHNDHLVNQVKDVIGSLLVTGHCTVNEVAPAMGYSTRTLQRHLKLEGATFQALVDAVRHQQAQAYLSADYYRLTDIAALLGYSELSAFTRSFKRWFGISPQKWRRGLQSRHSDSLRGSTA